ncbi:RNA polymerase sigma factor SigJ [Modestobacter sp. NPDC049651]|uniref:RNA polymerase sigma factor SigJ n=1 Tax=unclassified Modestobacter TaxID=2643866 RepID=UPI0033D932CB
MSRQAELAAAWTAARPRLVRVAYAVLGSAAEAEDVVSDCWLRLVDADARDPVADVEGWAVVAVARRALDVLRSARARRETYVGPWLPEPLVEAAADPADRVTLDESVGFALLVVLESLTPAERTAWVLHDLFGVPFPEVAAVVGRSPAAVRQLAARARAHVADRAPRFPVDPAVHAAALEAFLGAATGRDLGGLLAVLDPDVVLTSDGGGVVSAARRPVTGADKVARFLLGITGRWQPGQRLVLAPVNGVPGFLVLDGDRPYLVGSLTVTGGRVTRVDLVLAPDKLRAVRLS